ncbi:alpha/beta hydrolase [Pseudaminobacter sp. NGMCC 1.201702]|uniref:alpha/beta hydrolase n=1 Tax=Pseudaminobacter sp. NGMCC 1.201702 TaxID=3391825 RepID=UPI0039EE1982
MTANPNPAPMLRGEPAPAQLAIFENHVETHRLFRRTVTAADGRSRQIFGAVPKCKAPAPGHPVLYMLDGNAAFDALTAEHLATVTDLALIGIGYNTPFRFDPQARSLDYTPAPAGEGPTPDPNRPERMIGGADIFLDLLCGELQSAAEYGLAVNPNRRAIWGHSMAGLCVIYALLKRPAAFARYISASPSIWWSDQWMLDFERCAPQFADTASDVLIMLGDSERRSSPSGPHWDGPAPHTLEMIERLGRRAGIAVSSSILPGLGHAATLHASLKPGLAFAAYSEDLQHILPAEKG